MDLGQHATEKAGKNWGPSGMLFKLHLEDPTRYQRVNILNLDKLTALERIINRCSGRPMAKQEVPPRKHSQERKHIYSNPLCSFQAHHMFSLARRIKVVCPESFVALPFSQCSSEEVVHNLTGSRLTLDVQKTSVLCHTCCVTSSTSQILAQLHSQHFPRHLHCCHVLD